MQYALLLYEDESIYAGDRAEKVSKEMIDQHMAFRKEVGAARILSAGLKNTSATTTVSKVGDKRTVHDGPYTEAKEQLGGFYIIDVPGLDAAIALAKKLPVARDGGVEIRPLFTVTA